MTTKFASKPTGSTSSAAKPKRRRAIAQPPPKARAPSAAKSNGRKTSLDAKPRADASAADPLPSASATAQPSSGPRSATKSRRGQVRTDIQTTGAPATQLPAGHIVGDIQSRTAPGNQLGGDHGLRDPQAAAVAVELLFCAEFLDDVERVRIATENRLRAMDEAGVDAVIYEDQLIAFMQLEHQATLALQRVVRRHPLGPWIKRTKGVGEKQGARLIAAIGRVSWREEEIDQETGEVLAPPRPRRGPAEFWAYCGFVPGQKRQKGVKSNWNATAKMRAFLISEAMLKAGNREHYDRAKAKWADRDVKDGHKHNHALRVQAKEMLKDLFLEAKRVGA